MRYENDKVNVHGDFKIRSSSSCSYYSGNYFNSGILAIDGNFYQYNGNARNFQVNGTTVKFVGKGTHKITSESAETKIPNIFLTDGAELSFNGNFDGFDSVSSFTFSSEDTAVAKTSGNSVKSIGAGTTKLKIENNSGNSTTINLEVQGLVAGNSNFDGKVNIADAVILQRYLLGSYRISKVQWEQADMNQDGYVDVFDLCIMRHKLINK